MGLINPPGGGGGADANAFQIIQPPNGTSPTASSTNDTLNLTSSDSSVTITGTAASKTIDYSVGNISAAKITSGTLPVARGGTGLSAAGAEQTVLAVVGGVPSYQDPIINRSYTGYFEDFNASNQAWQRFLYSNSGGSVSWTDSTAGVPNAAHPGIWKYTSTAATDWHSFIPGSSSYNTWALGGGVTTMEAMVYLSALSNGTDTYTIRIGLNNTNQPYLGSYALSATYTSGANSGQWQLLAVNNNTTTTSSSTVAMAATTWTRVTIVVNAAGTLATLYINGVSACTVSTNLPNNSYLASLVPHMSFQRNAGTTSVYVIWDYFGISQLVTR